MPFDFTLPGQFQQWILIGTSSQKRRTFRNNINSGAFSKVVVVVVKPFLTLCFAFIFVPPAVAPNHGYLNRLL